MRMVDTFSEASAAEICKTLIALWKTRRDRETRFRERGERPNLIKFCSVHGLVAHAYRVGEHTLSMYESGLVMEALPLMRTTYESALMAHWIAQNRDGAEALANRAISNRRAVALTLERAKSAVLRAGAKGLLDIDKTLLETSSSSQAKYFEKLCEDLEPGGADAYTYYRLMCWYTHPSAHIVDSYIHLGEDGQTVDALRQEPAQLDANMWVHFLAFSLVWAGRAFDFIDEEKMHRSQLRSAARALGISDVLTLSASARKRIEDAERQARRSSWKGPRPKD
ncbi:DUF5677 domain-containing protein [Amycolatopsis sp. WAC 01375]|uniref:DUF5677 domain-containing protein n=1 Tax=Amycolatopsis sp. WAC 01375 TaxID=2203194 RepID=UPI000F794A34|nr:DUF5677 domain-containing protein [Amycolatopsis sp. WAC 01375]